jgi:hypothetical protein
LPHYRRRGRRFGERGQRGNELAAFAFEHRDALLELARLVEFESGHGEVVTDTEPGELALDGGQPRAFCLELRHHFSFRRANLAGGAKPATRGG